MDPERAKKPRRDPDPSEVNPARVGHSPAEELLVKARRVGLSIPSIRNAYRIVWKAYRARQRRMTRDLFEELEHSNTVDDFVTAAGKIHEFLLMTGHLPTRELQNLLSETTEDRKRACILQLLAEAGDSGSLRYFLAEIKSAERHDYLRPSTSLITAVTYLRLLKIPEELVISTLNETEVCVSRYVVPSAERKQLIIGALLLIGVLGNLESSYKFVANCLEDSDLDIAEEAVTALKQIWTRSGKGDHGSLDRYRNQIRSCLSRVLATHRSALDVLDPPTITPNEMLLAQVLPLLIQVDPESGKAALVSVILAALEKNDIFLQGTIIPAARSLAPNLRCELLTELTEGKDQQQVVTLCNFILG